jgi:hypothetical protein
MPPPIRICLRARDAIGNKLAGALISTVSPPLMRRLRTSSVLLGRGGERLRGPPRQLRRGLQGAWSEALLMDGGLGEAELTSGSRHRVHQALRPAGVDVGPERLSYMPVLRSRDADFELHQFCSEEEVSVFEGLLGNYGAGFRVPPIRICLRARDAIGNKLAGALISTVSPPLMTSWRK